MPLDLTLNWIDLAKIGIAFGVAFPVGWEREKEDKTAGVRTFPIVAMASCVYTLASTSVVGAGADQVARVAVGVMTGIGFLGAGVILRQGDKVHGTATAASIWNMGALGVAVAVGRIDLAMTMAVLNFLTLRVLKGFGVFKSPEKR